MRYLVVQDWDNTHGNHAGMVHMCNLLCEKYPNHYTMIVKECPPQLKRRSNPLLQKALGWLDRKRYRKAFVCDYMSICQDMFASLKEGDEVFLLEYNWPMTSQYEIACYIKKYYERVRIYALSHLTPTYFDQQRNARKMILKWDKPVDIHLTLGSSLTDYFKINGIPDNKISTGFHYVDNTYYNKMEISVHSPITIISIGALQRDFSMLSDIVRRCNTVNWIICKGRKDIDKLFSGLDNVMLVGYVEENELKKYMGMADLSMNVLEDTVGSNVITTSIAMGLGLIVSDVGSIHDYCDTSNAVFCKNDVDSFVDAINKLTETPNIIEKMQYSSVERVSRFTIEKVNEWFDSLK